MDGKGRTQGAIIAELSVASDDLALTLRVEVPHGSSWLGFSGAQDPELPLSEDAIRAFPPALLLAAAMPGALHQAYQSLESSDLEAQATRAERAAAEMKG